MGTIFSASEVLQMGVQIETNGKAFYREAAKAATAAPIRQVFEYLEGQEEKHIGSFSSLLGVIEDYQPAEAYPPEYFTYFKMLSQEHVFTKADTGVAVARSVKNDVDAVEAAIRFEKDSILFYYEIKNFVPIGSQPVVDELIAQEQEHYTKLMLFKNELLKVKGNIQ